MIKNIGKKITNVKIADDRKAVLFTFDDGNTAIGKTDGDCCSSSWIEHIELPTELPAIIISCGDIALNDDKDDEGGELSFYGYKIVTDKGDLIIDYRNASNGYYGGNICFDDEYFYGGVYGQNVSTMNWVEVK